MRVQSFESLSRTDEIRYPNPRLDSGKRYKHEQPYETADSTMSTSRTHNGLGPRESVEGSKENEVACTFAHLNPRVFMRSSNGEKGNGPAHITRT